MSESFLKSFAIPRFKLPPFVSAIGNRLPQWPHAVMLTAALNAAVKMKFLPQDSLELFEGRSFLIDVLDTGGRACFTFRGGLFRPLFTPLVTPDLTFSANLSAFLQLMARLTGAKKTLEVGVFLGSSSTWVALGLQNR